MKTTGIFEILKFSIPFKRYGEPVTIIPFGDVHRSSNHCHLEKWKEFLEDAKKIPNCWFLGMGDYDDLSSTSERQIINNNFLHDSTRESLEQLYKRYTQDFYKEIQFMRGRVIGLLEGNHYSTFQNGTNTTQLLCEKLGCKYLGVSAFIKLQFRKDEYRCQDLDLWAHHGIGGGRTISSSINSLEKMCLAANADIYLQGHNHRKSFNTESKLQLSDSRRGLNLNNRKIILARTGSFLKGYVPGKASYIADAGLSPTDIGAVKIVVTPQRTQPRISPGRKERKESVWLDIHGVV